MYLLFYIALPWQLEYAYNDHHKNSLKTIFYNIHKSSKSIWIHNKILLSIQFKMTNRPFQKKEDKVLLILSGEQSFNYMPTVTWPYAWVAWPIHLFIMCRKIHYGTKGLLQSHEPSWLPYNWTLISWKCGYLTCSKASEEECSHSIANQMSCKRAGGRVCNSPF